MVSAFFFSNSILYHIAAIIENIEIDTILDVQSYASEKDRAFHTRSKSANIRLSAVEIY
jgi:hypothetical protein